MKGRRSNATPMDRSGSCNALADRRMRFESGPSGAAGRGPRWGCGGSESAPVLGSVSILTGPIGAAVKPMVKGAQTWVAAMNAKGGLRCHKITYLVADDGGDPSRHQALVHQQVEQGHVQAFLQMS